MRARPLNGESPKAACADSLDLVDAAYDSPGSSKATMLKRLCLGGCPIATECLTFAMTSERHEWGIWGATGPNLRTNHGAVRAKRIPS